MSSTIPTTMHALVTAGQGQLPTVQLVPTPQIETHEILVKVAAVALNPYDWKIISTVKATTPGLILGIDLSGTVVAVGESVNGFRIGERVAAFVHGGDDKSVGAFAEYAKADAELVWHIPDITTFEEASTMNCGLWTAIQALVHKPRLGLTRIPESTPHDSAPWLLVYSGATSVGLFVIQLARLWGYRVVTTTSPKNFDLVRSLGADTAIDYRDVDVVQKIKAATGDTLAYALDTISEEQTQQAAVRAFGPQGGELLVILQPQDSAVKLREDVKVKYTLLFTVFGKAFNMLGRANVPAAPEDREQMAAWMTTISEQVRDGKIKANPVKLWPGGLAAIPDGLDYMREGKVSAEKIVYRIDA